MARGIAFKGLQWFFRLIEFLCAAVVLGIFSYFLATLNNHGLVVDNFVRSIEGVSGAAALYTLLCLILLCCISGFTIFTILAVLLDVAFIGGFIYIAWETRFGASSCSGFVTTPFGNGDVNTSQNSVVPPEGGVTILPSLHTACNLETAAFAVSIVAIVFFLLSIILDFVIWRYHKAEKKYGPSPANNYTGGRGRRRFWQRGPRGGAALAAGGLAAEKHPDHLPNHSTPADVRDSYATENTAVANEPVGYNTVNGGYGNTGNAYTHNDTYGPTGTHAGTVGSNY